MVQLNEVIPDPRYGAAISGQKSSALDRFSLWRTLFILFPSWGGMDATDSPDLGWYAWSGPRQCMHARNSRVREACGRRWRWSCMLAKLHWILRKGADPCVCACSLYLSRFVGIGFAW